MTYPKIALRNYRGGLNTSDLPAELDGGSDQYGLLREDPKHTVYADDCQFPTLRNVKVTHLGRMEKRDGQHKTIPSLPGTPQGFTRFRSTSGDSFYVIVQAGVVWAYNELTMALKQPYSGFDPTGQLSFTTLNGWLFMTDGITQPMMWDGILIDAVPIGIAPPTQSLGVVPSVNPDASSDLFPNGDFATGITLDHAYGTGDTAGGFTMHGPDVDFHDSANATCFPPEWAAFGLNWMLIDDVGEGILTTAYIPNYEIPGTPGVYAKQFQFTASYYLKENGYKMGAAIIVTTYSDAGGTTQIGQKTITLTGPYYNGAGTLVGNIPTISGQLDFSDTPAEILSFRVGVYGAAGNTHAIHFSITQLQIVASPPAPGGLLDSTPTGAVAYQWYWTYYNQDMNLESDPSDTSGAFPMTKQSATLTWTDVDAPPLATHVNIYRFGGTSSLYRLQGTYPLTPPSVVDNTSDVDLSLTVMHYTRTQPVTGIGFWVVSRSRIYAAGNPEHPCRVYFSSYGEPFYWPQTYDNLLTDGGFADIDEDAGNPIIGFAGLGSFLLVFRKIDVYLMEGDSLNDIKIRKVADVGCISRLTIVRAKNIVLWLAPDQMVYGISQDQPEPFALKLEKTLDSLQPYELTNACAGYFNQRYVLCFPRFFPDTPVAFMYDFRDGVQSWVDLSDTVFGAAQFDTTPGLLNYPELLFMTRDGYVDELGQPYNGIVSALTFTDPDFPVTINVETPHFELGRSSFTKRAKDIRLTGFASWEGDTPTVTITAESPGRTLVTATFSLTPNETLAGTLIYRKLPANLIGRRLYVTINGKFTAFQLQELQLGFVYVREDRYH